MDNSPEAVKSRVRSMTKSIRYKARKEGNLIKAFNDFMGTQSGISATERSAVKKSLGLSENKYKTAMSDWRAELNEVVSGEENDKTIKEKKVKNKIVINPTLGMKEAFEAIGGEIIEIAELVEADMKDAPSIKDAKPAKKTDVKYDSHMKVHAPTVKKEEKDHEKEKKKREMEQKTREKDIEMGRTPGKMKEEMSPKEVMLQKRKANIDIMIAKQRKKTMMQTKAAPTKSVDEGYDKPDEKLKTDRDGYRVPQKDADDAKARLLAKAKAKRAKSVEEGMHRDAKTGEVVDKAEVGKTYYPNMPKKKSSVALRKEKVKEETEDSLKDKRMMRGGVDGNVRYDRPPAKPNLSGKRKPDPKAKQRAVDKVRDDIIKKYGKGALM